MNRKDEHIELANDAQSQGQMNAFDAYILEPKALPELAVKNIDTTAKFLKWKCKLPLIISSMTGGAKEAGDINVRLAKIAAAWNIPFCTGSIGPLLKDTKNRKDYDMKKYLGDAPLFLNIGVHALQDNDKAKEVLRWTKDLNADGIIVHLNVLQEIIQPEGERNFEGHIEALKKLRNAYKGYITCKEVGVGIDRDSAKKLQKIGIDVIDVSGQGGTSWAWIEGERGTDDRGNIFKDFGIPTPLLLEDLYGLKTTIIGSGGVRNGLDIARCIALGATMAGMAKVMLTAAMRHTEEVVVSNIHSELQTAMLACGSKNVQALGKVRIRRLVALQDVRYTSCR